MARVKFVAGLDCSAPAAEMLPLVLRAQLEAMCALRKKALDWKNLEGVHDMRVLSRRLRSAISDVKPYLDPSDLPRLKLKAIARSLGAVRDEDVALVSLKELKVHAAQVADGLDLLVQEHNRKREESLTALKKVISHAAVKEFRREFLAGLSATSFATRLRSSEGPFSFSQLGVAVIDSRVKELVAASRCIYFPFEIKEIHRLRILAKRLRYAIELFAVCLGEQAGEMAKEISLLQDSLGGLHDCDVWIERLGSWLGRNVRESWSESDQLHLKESVVWLLKHFSGKRVEHYGDALSRWNQWEADLFLQKLKATIQ